METKPIPREAALVVNAHSRKGRDLFEIACEKLTAAGITLRAAHAVDDPDKMNATVREVVASGVPMVIVGGGDGSLSGVVDELVGKDCVFAVLPLGTANSFARSLDLPLDLDGAIEAIANGRRRRIDLGMIDDDYFVNGASIGLSTMIGETVPHKLKRYAGRLGYLAWALKCSVRFRPFRLQLDDGVQVQTMWATEVRILNGTHHGGVELSDQADVDSHELLLQAVVGRSKIALARDWYAKFFKLRDKDSCSRDFHGKCFTVSIDPPQRISIDGEVLACTPVTAKVAPGAIEVAVPAV
ncbi:diacylglycerol/lipid kinase family protein [Sphingomonas sp. M1-B02]|uniref:diacylglycerol/lipid kinase family protein n=1 Tax=Sphingomonas sp. M1-B02 TaxID=3114300 RepID=UPI00223F605B|nr:diacylglycerol kinase family protein [Sphingomonas sp. S6-11]UZK65099.1 diacylglycerol kinase family protein [Sphingomonas sp. S6-11]